MGGSGVRNPVARISAPHAKVETHFFFSSSPVRLSEPFTSTIAHWHEEARAEMAAVLPLPGGPWSRRPRFLSADPSHPSTKKSSSSLGQPSLAR